MTPEQQAERVEYIANAAVAAHERLLALERLLRSGVSVHRDTARWLVERRRAELRDALDLLADVRPPAA